MAKLSPVGKWIRSYRKDRNIPFHEMADSLELRPTSLSGIEFGRIPAPKWFADLFISTFETTQSQEQNLRDLTNKHPQPFAVVAHPRKQRHF